MFTRFISKIIKSPAAVKEQRQGAAPGSLPRWDAIIKTKPELWEDARKKSENGIPVLIPTSVGGDAAVTIIESLLGVALTLRGAKVHFLLCDGLLPACLRVHIGKIKDPSVITDYRLSDIMCKGCIAKGSSLYSATGLPVMYFSEFISDEERARLRSLAHDLPLGEIKSHTIGGLSVGEHAMAGALRFFSRGNLLDTPDEEKVLRRYFEAALLTTHVMQNVYKKHDFQAAVFNHGIYVPHGLIGEVSRANNVRIANWQVAYRKKCFIFSHHETYHHSLIYEPVSNWENIAWNKKTEEAALSYLKSRWYGTQDWIWFHDQPVHDASKIAGELKIDLKKPTVTLLTNVFWDAQLHYKANAFKDMLDWLLQTIEYFKGRKDLQLVIRVHPAEVRGSIPSRQPIVDEIAKRYPALPENIFLVKPESQISTYALCESSDSVIIYGTKTGVELTAMGVPVIVAGEAWIRNKGLTQDADSPGSYFGILDRLPAGKRLDEDVVRRARKYAFHFFFRRFVPVDFMEPCSSGVPYEIKIDSLEDLLPGRDKGLDVLCEGILKGSEFIYPAEKYI
ncbi:MAG: capsule biosynthesis protein [Nitrospirae bacterium]|nr:capsule biosynthesis protein [Nitrospirota bacterium]